MTTPLDRLAEAVKNIQFGDISPSIGTAIRHRQIERDNAARDLLANVAPELIAVVRAVNETTFLEPRPGDPYRHVNLSDYRRIRAALDALNAKLETLR